MKFFFYFFCRNQNHMVPRACYTRFLNSIRPRYSTFKHFRACSACDEIGSAYAQHEMKFVPRMLSVRWNLFRVCSAWIVHVKTVHILPLVEHEPKFISRMLSVPLNRFRLCSACDKIVPAYAQHTHAIIFENSQKYQIKMQILTINDRNFQQSSRNPSNRTKVKILKKKNFGLAHKKIWFR